MILGRFETDFFAAVLGVVFVLTTDVCVQELCNLLVLNWACPEMGQYSNRSALATITRMA